MNRLPVFIFPLNIMNKKIMSTTVFIKKLYPLAPHSRLWGLAGELLDMLFTRGISCLSISGRPEKYLIYWDGQEERKNA
jgi:hypothetical protein